MTKTVMITGAGSGFGKGTGLALADRGHHVIATTEIYTILFVGSVRCV